MNCACIDSSVESDEYPIVAMSQRCDETAILDSYSKKERVTRERRITLISDFFFPMKREENGTHVKRIDLYSQQCRPAHLRRVLMLGIESS